MTKKVNWSAPEWLADTVGSHRFIHDEKGRTIAACSSSDGISPRQRTSNANLISAAPELYDTLEEALFTYIQDHDENRPQCFKDAETALGEFLEPQWIERAKYVLGKARGPK